MNNISVCIEYNNFSPYRSSDGTSDEAAKLHKIGVDSFTRFYEAFTLSISMEVVTETLREVYEECSEEGWDGYRALPLRADAITDAMKLLSMMPSFFPMPAIAPHPNGGLTLRWSKGRTKTVVLAVYGNQVMDFAALKGVETKHGRLRFNEWLPKDIPTMLLESNIAHE